jgi:hypothetical protein
MERFTHSERWLAHYKIRLPEFMRYYYAMTANLDGNVGRRLDAWEKLGVGDDTLVVFGSDHGEMFGAHGWIQKRPDRVGSLELPGPEPGDPLGNLLLVDPVGAPVLAHEKSFLIRGDCIVERQDPSEKRRAGQ